jgi:putative copper resistance protein D
VATLWALPLDLWIRDVATLLTIGFILIGGVLAPRPDRRSGSIASIAAVVWLAALAMQSFLTVSEVLALPLSTSADPTIIWSLLTQTTLGRVMLIQFVLVAIVAVLSWVILDRVTGSILFGLAVIAAFLPGFNGHSGIDEGHASATISLGLHIVAASIWIGGLIATVSYAYRRAPGAERVIRRFSLVALISVIALAESGLLNAGLRLDGFASLVTSTYGALILTKVAIIIALIGFGWRQRTNLADRYRDEDGKTLILVRLSATELAWMGVVLGLSVALSRTAPPGFAAAGDRLNLLAVVVLGLAIPMAIAWAIPSRPSLPRWITAYPEPAAVALLVVMAGLASLSRTDILGPQTLGILTVVLLATTGLVMWWAVGESQPWGALVLLSLGVPALAWWIESDVVGGLGWATFVTVASTWALLLAYGFARRATNVSRAEVVA